MTVKRRFAIADRVGVMIDGEAAPGRCTPDRLYHFPASREVALLTGPCDFIPGHVVDDGEVKTDIGALAYRPAANELSRGSEAAVLIRPDDLELIPDANGQGTIVAREFRGDQVMLSVRLETGETVRSRRKSFSTLPAGSKVRVSPVKTIPFAAFPAD